MDIDYDMMRSARDARFLYIRNFSPELPYAGHIVYRNQSAIMQEWLRLQAEGSLTGAPSLWMRTSRPAEELYDVRRDPHQINDIATDPAHRATLARMRTAVTDWMSRIDDQGLINEPETDSADVAGRRAAADRAALHRAAPHDRRAFTGRHDRDRRRLWKWSSTCRRKARRSDTRRKTDRQPSGASTPARFASTRR